MSEPAAISREDALAYLRFLKSLGWTHVKESAQAYERTGEEAPNPPAPLPLREGGIESTSQRINESTPPPSHHRTVAPSHSSDLFDIVAQATPALPPEERLARLRAREEELRSCTRCKLSCTSNHWANRLVYGVGSAEAGIVFVGEGPGEEEDNQGIPFVGKAGQLLTKIIGAMGLKRDDVYICNVVKHRAPNNRDPETDEIDACEPFLIEQLDIIRPRVLVTLGNCATKTLLRTREGITRLRGTWQVYHGVPTMPTYHPAYLLRSYTRANREAVWSDMQAVLTKLKQLRGNL